MVVIQVCPPEMCFLKELFYQEKEFLSLLNKRKMFTVFIIPVRLLPCIHFCLSLKHFQNLKLLAPSGCRCWFVISLSCPVYRWSEGDLLCLAERRFLGWLHWSLLRPGSKTPHTVPLYKHINWLQQTFRKTLSYICVLWSNPEAVKLLTSACWKLVESDNEQD